MSRSRHQRAAVIAALRHGGVAIFPTESSYAIGCRYDSRAGKRELLRRKGRSDRRFTVIAASLKQVQAHFTLTAAQWQFVKRYWPGALSLVVSPTLAVRVPANLPLRRLAHAAQAPLIASSLNQSGQPPLFQIDNLPERFQTLPQENIGRLAKKKPSTVVVLRRGVVQVLRPGSVKV